MGAKAGTEHVGRAAGDPKGDVADLIRQLRSPAQGGPRRASAALRRLDPPPAWELIGALGAPGTRTSRSRS